MSLSGPQHQQLIQHLLKVKSETEAALVLLGQPDLLQPVPIRHGLQNEAAFFDHLRKTEPFGPVLTQMEVDGCKRLLNACAARAFSVSWTAYTLATAYHETAGQMRPIPEYGKGKGKPYGKPGRNGGQIPYGRGDVQLTWDDNYERADHELGLGGKLIANYELALDPIISAKIITCGMEQGWFTGHKLGDFLPELGFTKARPIVNGTDKASLIAGYAVNIQEGLLRGGWQ